MCAEKEKAAQLLFVTHFEAMKKLTESSPLVKDPDFELLAALYVMADLAALDSRKDRRELADSLTCQMALILPELDPDVLNARVRLYGQVLQGAKLRGDWFPGVPVLLGDDLFVRTEVLLGEILCNPGCADDYAGAPAPQIPVADMMTFTVSVMTPLMHELADLFVGISQL